MSRNNNQTKTTTDFVNPYSSDPEQAKRETLLGSVIIRFPFEKSKNFVNFCTKNKILVNSPQVFYEAYSRFLEAEMPGVNIYMSTIWGMCQEKLNRVSTEEKQYLNNRSGIWALDHSVQRPITFRAVCEYIENFH